MLNMKVKCKIVMSMAFSIVAFTLSFQLQAEDILGGGGNAAEKLILDWAKSKPSRLGYSVKFSVNIASSNLDMLQNGKIDFSILDAPLSDGELAKRNLLQLPFTLSGESIIVNLPNALAGTLRLDNSTIGKIFSGEIKSWNDPAITALNPKHELQNKPIIIVHSGETSTDYPVINSYLGKINDKWNTGNLSGKKRIWPANSVFKDGFSERIAALQHTTFSIGYLPMQYMSQYSLANVHIKNKDGKFVGLSDTSIIASTASVSFDGSPESLSIINKSGASSWPISNFTFIVVDKNRVKESKIAHILNIVNFGLKYGSLKSTIYNYVAIPEKLSNPISESIDTITDTSSSESIVAKLPPQKANQDNSAALEESRKAEERNRAAKKLADERERELAIREAKAARLAAEEAIKAAKAAKLEAEALAEKNRLIAKAEKDKIAKEKADKERLAKEKADKERAIELRNQKDEDPVEAYRRSMSSQ